ncbi:hypothetical protein RUM44_006377 [Polyplax serrata]|uniref:Origin recognition complex subunit 5 n=1 Tax=Polyplax serrata TaxID=468196 RepID=A0ABR1AJG7_POLSC
MDVTDPPGSDEFHPSNFAENLEKLKSKIRCRDEEISYVHRLLGQVPTSEPPPTLFIQGDSATGKSLIVKSCLDVGKFCYALVNCGEGYSLKLLFESILNQIAKHKLTEENSFQPYAKCNNFLEFVINLQSISEKFNVGKLNDNKSLSVIIVLDKAEILRKFDKHVITTFIKLRELSKLKISVVFLSILPWTSFMVDDNPTEPIIYYLGNYNQKQIIDILKLDKPSDVSMKFYENFLNLFLSIFYQTCHDVRELKYQAKLNFEHYSKPIKMGELTENDGSELWKRSQAFFKKSLKSLYLKMDNESDNFEKVTSMTSQVVNLELPYYSKYLLIASYLASFNPASEDKQLFLKNSGKMKKSKRTKAERVKLYLVGPKPFGIQRLFAIVSAILDDEKFNLNADLFIEISSLVKMNLLTQISEDVLDGPTFKCNVGLQFIDVISKNVQFPIRHYLVDFTHS